VCDGAIVPHPTAAGSSMDLLLALKAVLLGIVEGLTEFLPISSTGHLIVAGSLIGFDTAVGKERADTFEIAIQTGAMFAIIWEYRTRLARTLAGMASEAAAQRFAVNVAVAFMPAVVLGLLFAKAIKHYLFFPVPVATAFVVGGLIILWVERRSTAVTPRVQTVDDMTPLDALKVGLMQCFALIPGTSRSGATIIGGMLMGLSRKAATEFSFFLAIPTLIGAGIYSMYKQRDALVAADVPLFGVGTIVSFVFALLCVRWLIRYISTHSFAAFAWYRIFFGGVILLTSYMGWISWVD
jgi:undecaprenyl-diphosphatase